MDYDMVPFELSSHCRTLTQRHISSALSPEVLLYVFVCACVCGGEQQIQSMQVKLWAAFDH